MSLQELDVIRGMLRETDLGLAGPPETARETFEAMQANFPVRDGLVFEETSLGGVPAVTAGASAGAGDQTLLYLHGGAYAVGSAWGYRSLWGELVAAAGVDGVAIDYRRAPEDPFPAAVDDALAAYRALLESGRPARSIVVAGDSAGGGLAVAMLVAARDGGLEMPAAALAISPWADLGCAGASIAEKAHEDLSLSAPELRVLAGRYLDGADAGDPLASPIHADLTGLPPLLIQVGSAEILFDDSVRLAARAGAQGVRVTLDVWPGMPHVWPLFSAMLGEARDAADAAGAWLRERLDRAA
jgi:acetyl esterase/lipase